ncbi:4Fe-4S dicluster domain-containing protein [Mitsuokella sp. oral taxon 131]|uniref:4Fe-4S dicluster domain-containing protein n=1 Tax=Mitsuokella sp. oral taxon 131 TaxID=1321780 RepID=UPI0009DBB42C|nr:4Fe-4S dicluster domain-containing protein [Mitsuokella sp. oral taxon 131]
MSLLSKRYAFLVHTDRCIGCNACEIACKNFYQQEASVHWRKVYYMQEKDLPQPCRVSVSLACNHCDAPSCMKACPTSAYTKRDDGIVMHDQDRCIASVVYWEVSPACSAFSRPPLSTPSPHALRGTPPSPCCSSC